MIEEKIKTDSIIKDFCHAPRISGTALDDKIIQRIAQEFQAMGYNPAIENYTFTGWEVLEPPEVIELNTGKLFSSRAITWSGGTKGVEARGVVSKKGNKGFWGSEGSVYFDKWAISENGVEHGEVYIIGKYPTHLVLPHPEKEDIAYIAMMPQDLEYLSKNKSKIKLTIKTKFKPGTQSANVIATKAGRTNQELIISAHHDTVYDDREGLHDNGGGCIALLKLAREFKDINTNHTIRFISMGAEEFNSVGADHYIKQRRESKTLSNIKAYINIDFVTQSPDEIGAICNEHFDEVIREIFKKDCLKGKTKKFPDSFGRKMDASDARVFQNTGIPALHILFEEGYYPHIEGRLEGDLSKILANIDFNTRILRATILKADQYFS